MTDPQAPFSAELVPFPVADRLPGVPTPVEMRDRIADSFNRAVQREREQRGEVHQQADVWRMVRAVEGFRDLMGQYSQAFTTVATSAKGVLEEELLESVGEQDGIPMGRLNVPDGDGSTIQVKPKTANEHDIDTTQVVSTLVALVVEEWATDEHRPEPAEAPEEFAIDVALRTLAMVGAATMKVTQVRGLAEMLGQRGFDQLAGIALGSIKTRKLYKGVAVERKAS